MCYSIVLLRCRRFGSWNEACIIETDARRLAKNRIHSFVNGGIVIRDRRHARLCLVFYIITDSLSCVSVIMRPS